MSGFRNYRPKKKGTDKDFVSFSITIPKEQWETLKHHSNITMMPISRIVSYAIDNELDCKVPFHYPVEEPQNQYVQYAYNQESHLIFQFLKRFPSGLSRDSLLLFRRSIGVPDKVTLMLGLRELFKTGLIYETAKKPRSNQFEYHPTYKWIRVRKQEEKDGPTGEETSDRPEAEEQVEG